MDLDELCERLLAHYDVEGWWPHESKFEIMVGAMLTQQAAWDAVAKALGGLRGAGLLDIDALADCAPERLGTIIRPAGFYKQKSHRIIALARHLRDAHAGKLDFLSSGDLKTVRAELISLPGIGDETADAILLFAGHRPKFVAAAYVLRTFDRTGVLSSGTYASAQNLVESRWPDDAVRYRDLYAACVQHCKTVCLTRPACAACQLIDVCPYPLRRG
ncbi:MAG TPA: hypothetical protein VLH13_03410 [Methanomassiliicoccales archaeon]|nr:hypothetical protein [Methanomassiliicoccales archaeon]